MTDSSSDVAIHDLRALDAIEQNENLSQRDLAKSIGVALGHTNQIIKRLVRKGYVKTQQVNARRMAYYLTPQGFSEKLRLVMAYTRYTIGFFTSVREVVSAGLAEAQRKHGARTVAIVGTGELAEAVYLSIQELELELVAAYSQTPSAKKLWFGVPLMPVAGDETMAADILVETRLPQSGIEPSVPWQIPVLNVPHLLGNGLNLFAQRVDAEGRKAR